MKFPCAKSTPIPFSRSTAATLPTPSATVSSPITCPTWLIDSTIARSRVSVTRSLMNLPSILRKLTGSSLR